MCGIVGVFNTNGEPVPAPLIRTMASSLSHRGPDGEGFWVDSFVGFGHRRLSIIDLSTHGHQPMRTVDGRYTITYNGEVYNYANLRAELEAKGHSFASQTDTEVVLKAFAEWGPDCVRRFNGMFAFGIWDSQEQQLFIARDRYGIKPLYFWQYGSQFAFASEVKAMLHLPAFKTKLSVNALNQYLSFQNVFTDDCLFEGVKLLPAGCTVTLNLGGVSTLKQNQYWDYRYEEDHSIGEQEAVDEVQRLFSQAVNRQLVSDVEVGSYLSGGIDSGAITCVSAQTYPNLKTFTCGFDLSSASGLELNFDERSRAEYLSNLYKTEHYEVVLKAGDLERVISDLVWSLEDLRVGQSYPNYYVSRLASKFVKVVMSGAGGDELFAGYPWRYYRAVVNDDVDHYLDKYYKYWQRLIPDRFKPDFYNPDIYPEILANPTKDHFKTVMSGFGTSGSKISSPEEYVNRSLYFESKTFLHGLLVLEDKLSMSHSVETRIPFLDNDLVDFAMKVPTHFKLQNLKEVIRLNENEPGNKTRQYFQKTRDGKLLLRKAMEKYVPLEYAQAVKQGFSGPDGSWFKGESIDYVRDLLCIRNAGIYDYLQFDFVQSLLEEHFSGKQNRRLLIWSLLCLEHWLKRFS